MKPGKLFACMVIGGVLLVVPAMAGKRGSASDQERPRLVDLAQLD